MRDAVDVDAAGGDVGGDQHVDLAGAERPKCLLAGTLAEVAVHRGRGEPALAEVGGHPVAGTAGSAEHDGEASPLGLQDAGQELGLVHLVGPVDVLLDGVDGRRLVVGAGRPDVRGLAHVLAGQRDDDARHRRGEEHRLPVVGGHRHDALDVGEEAQVEHLVGLVEDQHLDVAQVDVPLVREVDQPTGGADDDVDPLPERLDLRLVGTAAVDLEDAHAAAGTSQAQVLGDLDAELAGRDDDERLRLPGGSEELHVVVGGRDEALQQRDAEAQRLARTGLGLADDVLPGEGDREGHLLDGEGVDDADGFECFTCFGEYAELSERGQDGSPSSRQSVALFW